MNKICPNHCYATDKDVLRCPRCGELLEKTRMSESEIIKETELRQKAAWSALGRRDFERIDNTKMREAKRKMEEAEKRYYYNQKKYANT